MDGALGAAWRVPPRPPQNLSMIRRFLLPLALFASILAAMAAPAAHAQDAVHVVALGENLTQIARSYDVTLEELIAYNGITDPSVIRVGMQLLIPGQGIASQARYGTPATSDALPAGNGYYTVRQGDTLARIAERNGMALGDLMRLNGLSNSLFIWVGQRLRLSARVDASPIAVDQTERSDLAGAIYVVARGDTLAEIAQKFGVSMQDIMAANGLPNAGFVWEGQRLRIKQRPSAAPYTAIGDGTVAVVDGQRRIEINLTEQTLTAWQDDVAILFTTISSGLPGSPTITGRFQIGAKYQSAHMTDPGYDLPGVPWVMYFYGSFAIQGAYWHNNFGTPMSRGSIDTRVDEAQFLYNWAPSGTEVYVHY